MRFASLSFFLALLSALSAAPSHLDLRRDAVAAYNRKDYAAARIAISRALELRPDSPGYLHNLAAIAALTSDKPAALQALRRLAALGVATAVERDPDLASLQAEPEFLRITRRLAENRSLQGESVVWAELSGRVGIIEGIAFRPRTGDVFLSDVHLRGIWRRDRNGQITRFSAEDEELLGIFGLAIDEPRNTLWAAMGALPEMSGYTPDLKGGAGLAEFDLTTGDLRRVIAVTNDGRDHSLSDLVVTENGIVYASDSRAPVIWQLSPGDDELVKLAESPQFLSLQGMALADRLLIVADFSNGVFVVGLDAGEHGRSAEASIRSLAPPENTTLVGIDGVVAVPGGIVAVQNGVLPQRVIHLTFSPDFRTITGLKVLAAATPHLDDLALVTLVDDRPTLIAGAGWESFDPLRTSAPPEHTVRILQVSFP